MKPTARGPGATARNAVAPALIVVSVLVILLLCLLYVLPYLSSLGKPTAQEIEREMQRDLPPGSGAREIETWFTSRGIEFRYVEGDPRLSDPEARYQGLIRRVQMTVLGEIDLRLNVYVDAQRRVTRIAVQRVQVGF